MAMSVFSVQALTPVAVADNTNMTNGGYLGLQGGSSIQVSKIWEVSIGGQATASAPTFMTLAYDSTVGVTLAALVSPNANGPMNPATVALTAPVVGFISATTVPKRTNSLVLPKLQFSFNAFGGVAFWRAGSEGMCFEMLGNAASFGEVSLSAFTGGTPGAINAHIVFETK